VAGSGTGSVPGPGLERLLDEAIRAARAAWPAVELSEEAFLTQLAHALRRGGARSVEDWLARGTASDLYLACGCAQGDPAALARSLYPGAAQHHAAQPGGATPRRPHGRR